MNTRRRNLFNKRIMFIKNLRESMLKSLIGETTRDIEQLVAFLPEIRNTGSRRTS